ncbi:hypothetical protein CDAR_470121 [Caerostris darwini]|uniref:Ycf15 n=1 Tax=Caerostris darwini TaxID=1538125 RepID=A0AAV4WBM9_9ARAC|nr:hypothetical protein CDAR_470121 [Caerostris darwini]
MDRAYFFKKYHLSSILTTAKFKNHSCHQYMNRRIRYKSTLLTQPLDVRVGSFLLSPKRNVHRSLGANEAAFFPIDSGAVWSNRDVSIRKSTLTTA